MKQALLTVLVPFTRQRQGRVERLLDELGAYDKGSPGTPQGLDRMARRRLPAFVHFLSMLVVPACEGAADAHLVIELCADGPEAEALPRLADAMAGPLRAVIDETGHEVGDTRPALVDFLEERCLSFGTRLFSRPGLVFRGTPEMTVERILAEFRLARRLRRLLRNKECPSGSAIRILRFARSRIFADPRMKWAFVSEPVQLLGPERPLLDKAKQLALAALRDYLWVLLPGPPLLGFISWHYWGSRIDTALWHMTIAFLCEIALAAVVGALVYMWLRREEERDVPRDVEPEPGHMESVTARENLPGVAQNHLAGISIMKPGLVRLIALRVALWLIAEWRSGARPGFLDRIGTIHFARWVLLPDARQLLFVSNYDGSWQSYLEDFIARLRAGLTSVWSNTVDFPKTASLFLGGAKDGSRFKRWARRQQVATRFWYCAYPRLTTDRIRTHAAMRRGFASASTEVQAAEWLAMFGHAPPSNVEKDDVSALALNGLPLMTHACCLVLRLGGKEDAREWASALQKRLSYGEHAQMKRHGLIVGFTATGLRKLDLDRAALETFTTAFQEGMASPSRSRVLGDTETSGWHWGGKEKPGEEKKPDVDAVLIVYARDDRRLERYADALVRHLERLGHGVLRRVLMEPLPERVQGADRTHPEEPFGFRDGISQPVMRGSSGWAKPEKEMHVVEPGELLLGYRDNLGNISPAPSSKGEDIGRNGTFLVIRQLEQDRGEFDKYLRDRARELERDPRVQGLTGDDLEHWVAAKMVGRWRDGSSLVRNPHPPGKKEKRAPDNDLRFGREDPDGLRCPFGAHVRRANPRDSFEPGSEVQLAISNRHRILRVGRKYQPEPGGKPGIMFMCINADIERQFEFLQQSWILGSNFHALDDEVDPIMGYRGARDSMTVPTPRGPVRLQGLAKFVTVLGGAYFFLPGRRALREILGETAW